MTEEDHRPNAGQPWSACDGRTLKEAFRAAAAWIEAHCEEINALNVFPVPDGDTGTNMVLTCQAALEEMARAGDSLPEIMHAVAHGSLMGARGNSGVILSQILRGMARSFDNKTSFTTQDVAAAFKEGAATAYRGVIKPVEGTILTVIRETAETASAVAGETTSVVEMLHALVDAAKSSVARTPSLLPALQQAGVVDAGGQGLYILLEGLQRYLHGESAEAKPVSRADLQRVEVPEAGYGYDVQFIVHGEGLDVEAIRAHLAAVSESTLVVGDDRAVKVHVHAANPGPILEYGANLGSLSRVIVENMQEQYQQFRAGRQNDRDADNQAPAAHALPHQLVAAQSANTTQLTGISTVVVAAGSGLERVFHSLQATAVVPGGQTMNPSTKDILKAIESVPTNDVIVLPNNKNIIMAAQEARQISPKNVLIVPTKTIPEGIAALLSLNYDADLETNRVNMERAAASVRSGEITTAVRDSHVDGLDVRKGQIIGLADDHLVAVGDDMASVLLATLVALRAADAELLTLYYGDSVQAADAMAMAERVRTAYPAAQVELVEGGQPHYAYILSAE